MSDRDAIDPTLLVELEELGDAALARRMVDLFVAQGERGLDLMRHALDAADARTLERVAHGLKATAGHVGALEVCQLAASLEEAARRGTLDGLGPVTERLACAFARAVAALAHALRARGLDDSGERS